MKSESEGHKTLLCKPHTIQKSQLRMYVRQKRKFKATKGEFNENYRNLACVQINGTYSVTGKERQSPAAQQQHRAKSSRWTTPLQIRLLQQRG